LGHALIFKMLRLVLLVGLTIVRIGTVFTKYACWWLDEGMPRALDTGHKECWEEAKGQKKSHIGRNAKGDPTKEDHQPLASIAPTITLESSTDRLEPLPQMPTMLYMPMPPPRTPSSPMFKGANVTEFLKRYEDLCSDYYVSASDRFARLPRYCIQPIAETIKSLKEWKDKDYAALKKVLLAEYKNNDTH
jgi:hypothetical protein